MLNVGSIAPDVDLHFHDGSRARLSDYRFSRTVVLYFYPKDFTWGCTRQACSFASHYQEIVSRHALLIGISADPPDQHREFALRYRLPFLLASDPSLTIAKAYDALALGFRRLRLTYVIDRSGVIRGVVHHEIIVENHWRSVVKILEHLNVGEAHENNH